MRSTFLPEYLKQLSPQMWISTSCTNSCTSLENILCHMVLLSASLSCGSSRNTRICRYFGYRDNANALNGLEYTEVRGADTSSSCITPSEPLSGRAGRFHVSSSAQYKNSCWISLLVSMARRLSNSHPPSYAQRDCSPF